MRLSDFLEEVGKPIAYYPALAKVLGGVREAIFLCQFAYWHGKQHDSDGWIYKTQEEIEEETGLDPNEQRAARLQLKRLNVLHEKKVGLPAKNHYYFNWEVLDRLFCNKLGGKNIDEDLVNTIDIFKSTLKSLGLLGYQRALKSNIKAEIVDYATVLIDNKGICHLCGRSIIYGPGQKGARLQFDHVVPLSKGGTHTWSNIKPAHARCNLLKNNGKDTTSRSDSGQPVVRTPDNQSFGLRTTYIYRDYLKDYYRDYYRERKPFFKKSIRRGKETFP